MKNLLLLFFLVVASIGYAQTRIYVAEGTSGIVNNATNGNVGIGVSSPSATLHVAGNLKTTAQITGREYISVEKGGSYRVSMNGQSNGYITGRNDLLENKFLINSLGSSYFNGGNVGIGTANPSAVLHVVGNLKTTAQIIGTEYVSVAKGGSYRVSMNGQSDGYVTGRNDLLETKFYISSNGTSYFNGGNVAIGTTDPKGYKLAVAGKMISEEVVVKLQTAWPDYVFEADYPLIPLQDLEIYLQENKHLPNIPTATEVAEEGIKLGEMNAKLLEKVEELTLYLIEQSKQIKQLQQEIKILKTKGQ